MNGYGSHTFSMMNAENERVWVKFHFKMQQGIKNLTDAEAEVIIEMTAKATGATCSKALRGVSSPDGPCMFRY